MIIELSSLLVGLIGLWLGTEWTVNNAIRIASHHHLSELFVGVGILAIGSDLPELAVAVDAGIKILHDTPASGLVIGSSIGSAFAQIGLVLGIAGYSGYLLIGRRFLIIHGSALIGSILLLWLLAYDGEISRVDGLVLAFTFVLHFLLSLRDEINGGKAKSQTENLKLESIIPTWAKLAGGLCVVIASSEVTVEAALNLALRLDIAQSLIATIIVGIGTSLPELSISLNAVHQKRGALSVGNIIGSNIFDTLVPIGSAAIIAPLIFDDTMLYFDLPALALLSMVVVYFFYHKKGLQKNEALTLIGLYCLYAVSSIYLKSVA